MTEVSRKLKQMTAILLFSLPAMLVFSGCGSTTRIIQPATHTTLGSMQETYEHIPKPLAEIPPSTASQNADFGRFVKKLFGDIQRYKKDLYGNKMYRYGKNRTHTTPQRYKTGEQIKTKQIKGSLHPHFSEKVKKDYKDPLRNAL